MKKKRVHHFSLLLRGKHDNLNFATMNSKHILSVLTNGNQFIFSFDTTFVRLLDFGKHNGVV